MSRVNCDANTHDDWAGTREAKWGSNEWGGEREMLAQIRGVQWIKRQWLAIGYNYALSNSRFLKTEFHVKYLSVKKHNYVADLAIWNHPGLANENRRWVSIRRPHSFMLTPMADPQLQEQQFIGQCGRYMWLLFLRDYNIAEEDWPQTFQHIVKCRMWSVIITLQVQRGEEHGFRGLQGPSQPPPLIFPVQAKTERDELAGPCFNPHVNNMIPSSLAKGKEGGEKNGPKKDGRKTLTH